MLRFYRLTFKTCFWNLYKDTKSLPELARVYKALAKNESCRNATIRKGNSTYTVLFYLYISRKGKTAVAKTGNEEDNGGHPHSRPINSENIDRLPFIYQKE